MHTFFINTSGNALGNYADILEIQSVTRQLVSLECPLAEWNDPENGYEACVRKMGELIDNFKDINNDFNLILYIDLLPYEIYTSIPMEKHLDRYACLKVFHAVLTHYIKCTFLYALDKCNRVPKEVVLVFEENQVPKDGNETTDYGKELIRSFTKKVLGLPSDSEIEHIVHSDAVGADGALAAQIVDCAHSCIGERVLHTYPDQIDVFLSEVKAHDTFERDFANLLEKIIRCYDEDIKTIPSVIFVTNRRAGITNKQEKVRRDLRLCFYVSECVRDETLLKSFPEINWEKAAEGLRAKKAAFRRKLRETQKLSEDFSALKLAPQLYPFDHERFALDEFGRRGKMLEIVDVEEEKDEKREEKDIEDGVIRPKGKKAVVEKEMYVRNLFPNGGYEEFDYQGNDFDDRILGTKATAEQYAAAAQKLRQHHLDYLHRLKVHVSNRLSNYAGRSSENVHALLRKREVSVGESDFIDTARDYPYKDPQKTEEKNKLKTVETISKTAYTSTLLNYMEFCAGRSVALTDIEDLCNWFVTIVFQIEESLRKIKRIAIGLLVAVLVLYIPFAVLQWESITENAVTVAVALLSVAVPIIMLYIVLAIASWLQRRKYLKAWKEFKEKSDRVLKENAIAAEKYDRLLSAYIPALRWVYEYKLDVEFHAACCQMATAKIAHHLQKLRDRVVIVGNIIEDLEADISEGEQTTGEEKDDEIDYNVAFCSGEKNREFYSIIDSCFSKSVCN